MTSPRLPFPPPPPEERVDGLKQRGGPESRSHLKRPKHRSAQGAADVPLSLKARLVLRTLAAASEDFTTLPVGGVLPVRLCPGSISPGVH